MLRSLSMPWDRQPQELAAFRPGWFGFNFGFNPHGNNGGVMAPLPASGITAGPAGRGLQFATGNVSTTCGSIVPGISEGITVAMVAEPLVATTANNFLFGESAASVGAYNYGFYEASNGGMRFFVHNGTSGVQADSGIIWGAILEPQIWVATFGNGDNNIRMYRNGVAPGGSSAAQTGTIKRDATAHLSIQRWNTSGASMRMYTGAVLPRCMSAKEVWDSFNNLRVTWRTLLVSRKIDAYVPESVPGVYIRNHVLTSRQAVARASRW